MEPEKPAYKKQVSQGRLGHSSGSLLTGWQSDCKQHGVCTPMSLPDLQSYYLQRVNFCDLDTVNLKFF